MPDGIAVADVPADKTKATPRVAFQNWCGVPTGIRTPVIAVKGRCPRPLDDRVKTLELSDIKLWWR